MGYHETFEPLRVTAHLRTGVISDQWLPLDGILLYQACRRQFGAQGATLPGGGAVCKLASVPLKIIHPGEPHWYYACSWAQPRPWWVAEGKDHWNKRCDLGLAHLVDFHGRRGKVLVGQGRYRAYHMPVFYRVALRVDWYCAGDRADVEALLSTMTHIGKKGTQGWGRVIKWDVEPWPEDWSVWRAGKLTRGIPATDAAVTGPVNLMHYGLRPSYYRKQNQMLLVMPP